MLCSADPPEPLPPLERHTCNDRMGRGHRARSAPRYQPESIAGIPLAAAMKYSVTRCEVADTSGQNRRARGPDPANRGDRRRRGKTQSQRHCAHTCSTACRCVVASRGTLLQAASCSARRSLQRRLRGSYRRCATRSSRRSRCRRQPSASLLICWIRNGLRPDQGSPAISRLCAIARGSAPSDVCIGLPVVELSVSRHSVV